MIERFPAAPGDVARVVEFVLELEKLKGVSRRTRPIGLERFENSAEHSWQIALLASSLAPFAPAAIDLPRVVSMLLVHDIGEIDAGDVFVYAEAPRAERKAAELAAVTRIFGLLDEPQCSTFLDLWREFDDGETAESRFANAADRAMPVLLNLANRGQSWRENGISYERVVARVGPPIRAGCPALWEHLAERLEAERRDGWFGIGESSPESRIG